MQLNKDIMPRLLKRSDRVWRVKGDVSKRYCFEEPGVPEEADYMELRYPASASPMDRNASGRTFSRVFASHQTALERFLLSRDLMGPCWLTVTPQRSRLNHDNPTRALSRSLVCVCCLCCTSDQQRAPQRRQHQLVQVRGLGGSPHTRDTSVSGCPHAAHTLAERHEVGDAEEEHVL